MARPSGRVRPFVTVAVFGVISASACAASAGDVPKYSELPSGHVTTRPTTAKPSVISAREHVPGFFVAVPKSSPQQPARSHHITVTGNSVTAAQIRAGENGDSDDRERGACFSDPSMDGDDEEGDAAARPWARGGMAQVDMWPKSVDNASAGVAAVHRERLVTDNGRATLESVDAWVDPTTHGVRLIARSSLPLVQVASATFGITVYAGRDERAEGTRYVQFVVVRRPHSSSNSVRLGRMTAMGQDGDEVDAGGCGHLRLQLAVEPHDGETAVVLAPVELPARGAAKASAPQPPSDKAEQTGGPRRKSALSKSVLARLGKRGRRPLPSRPKSEPDAPAEREARTRDMQMHLGVSQSSRDKEPLLAISFGWASREAVQRVSDDDDDDG